MNYFLDAAVSIETLTVMRCSAIEMKVVHSHTHVITLQLFDTVQQCVQFVMRSEHRNCFCHQYWTITWTQKRKNLCNNISISNKRFANFASTVQKE